MSEKTILTDKKSLISKFSDAGISLELLANASDAAKLLSPQSVSKESNALNPRHFNDYHVFLLEIARKKSI